MEIRQVWSPIGGDFQTQHTLRIMRDEVHASLRDPDVIRAAVNVVRSVDGRSFRSLCGAIHHWSALQVSFLPDPNIPDAGEFLRTPSVVLEEIRKYGYARIDCDDAAMFTAALLSAVGVTCRFRACAYFTESNPYEHVYTEGLTEAGWYPLDITSRGSHPPISRSLYLEV